ncbi:MAG: hypothetical protein IJT20_02340 [Synergistaceae bacterium]|nr:hypothetical protein [Synergistaceae bacterium]
MSKFVKFVKIYCSPPYIGRRKVNFIIKRIISEASLSAKTHDIKNFHVIIDKKLY